MNPDSMVGLVRLNSGRQPVAPHESHRSWETTAPNSQLRPPHWYLSGQRGKNVLDVQHRTESGIGELGGQHSVCVEGGV